MRFSECANQPGDVARRKLDGRIAIKVGEGSYRVVYPEGCSYVCGEGMLSGDDWEPLAPQTPIEGLQRFSIDYRGGRALEKLDGQWVEYSDLESVALVREDTERIKQLREHVERNANLVSDCLDVVPGGITNCMPIERVPAEIEERVAKLQRDLEAAEDRAEALEQERDELKKEVAEQSKAMRHGLDEYSKLERKYERACREVAERFVDDAGGIENLTNMVKEWGDAVQNFMNAPASTATTPCEAIKEVAERVRERIGDPMADNLVNLATHIESELAKLREQLAGKYVLGEPLVRLYHGQYVCRVSNNGKKFDCYQVDTDQTDGITPFGDYKYYLDPRPLPTLPEAEPVPEVPSVPKFLDPAGLLGALQLRGTGEVGYAFHLPGVATNPIYVMTENILTDNWWPSACVIYTKPVRWPDGSVKPIEPSPELLAALGGAKDA